MITLIKIIAVLLAWIFFYKILQARHKRMPGIKATIITLLFASLIITMSMGLYTRLDNVINPHTTTQNEVL